MAIFGSLEKENEEESIILAGKGTFGHSLMMHIMQHKVSKTQYTPESIIQLAKADVLNSNPDLAKYGDTFFQLGNKFSLASASAHFAELERTATGILKQIQRNSEIICKMIGEDSTLPENQPLILTEVVIYNPDTDIPGTVDLMVVYPNGAVGIYDYKFMQMSSTGPEVAKPARYKINNFDTQIAAYKHILKHGYGVKAFAETRIIPARMRLNKIRHEGFSVLEMGSTDLSGPLRDYLTQIPVANENIFAVANNDVEKAKRGVKDANIGLDRLYKLRDSLRKDFENTRSLKAEERLNRIEDAIQNLLVFRDGEFIFSEIREMYNTLSTRGAIPFGENGALSVEELAEMYSWVKSFDGFTTSVQEFIEFKDAEERTKFNQLSTWLASFSNQIEHKAMEAAEAIYGVSMMDEDALNRSYGYMSREFKRLSKIDIPSFMVLRAMVADMFERRRQAYNEYEERVAAMTEDLSQWAKDNKMSLQAAFELLVDKKRGRLILEWDDSAFEDLHEAQESKNYEWLIANTQIQKNPESGKLEYIGEAKTLYEKAKKKFEARIAKRRAMYPGMDYRYDSIVKLWNQRYDISKFPEAAFERSNRFIRLKSGIDKYQSEAWKNINAPGNQALKDYYEEHTRIISELEELTGKSLGRGFIANITKGLVAHMVENGVMSGLSNVGESIRRFSEIREHDTMFGHGADIIDPITKRKKRMVPFLYTDPIQGRNTGRDYEEADAEARRKHPDTNSLAYKFERERILKRKSYEHGLKSKSYDLSKSLLTMVDSALRFYEATQNEDMALLLRAILKSDYQKFELGERKASKSKYLDAESSIKGAPEAIVELFDRYIDMYIYGRAMQTEDNGVPLRLPTLGIPGFEKQREKRAQREELEKIADMPKRKYSRVKMLLGLKMYVSMKTLALAPKLIIANLIGVRTNMMMMASEGKYFTSNQLHKAELAMLRRDAKYRAAFNTFEIYTHNAAKVKADKLSSGRATRLLSSEMLFIGHRLGDETIDDNVLYAMLMNYGFDSEGRIRKLSNLPTGAQSFLDMSVLQSGKLHVPGLTDSFSAMVEFKNLVKTVATKIKGAMPEDNKAIYNTNLLWSIVMHFRTWFPGVAETRFGALEWNADTKELDMGRFRSVLGQDLIDRPLNTLGELLGQIATLGLVKTRLLSNSTKERELAKKHLDSVVKTLSKKEQDMLAKNGVTVDTVIDLKAQKMRGVATELRLMFIILGLMLAFKKMDDDDMPWWQKMIVRNLQASLTRGYYELSFFWNPGSFLVITKSPVAMTGLIGDIRNLMKNTWDETLDLVYGEDIRMPDMGKTGKGDKTPKGYYTLKMIPFLNPWSEVFDFFNKYGERMMDEVTTDKEAQEIMDSVVIDSLEEYKEPELEEIPEQ